MRLKNEGERSVKTNERILGYARKKVTTPRFADWAIERAKLASWHKWFAIYPVRLDEGGTAYLKAVYRRAIFNDDNLGEPPTFVFSAKYKS